MKNQKPRLAAELWSLWARGEQCGKAVGNSSELSTVFPYDRDPVPLAALVHKSIGQKGRNEQFRTS